jgi:protein-ribulosamine 3-kinase
MPRAARAHPRGARLLIPETLAEALSTALGSACVAGVAVGGGCISPAWRVALADGRRVFVKQAPAGAAEDLLAAEAESLERLAATRAVRVPAVLGRDTAWLALEWLEPGSATAAKWQQLGESLAALHRVRSARFGWHRDNYIGTLPQHNAVTDDWPTFWREHRLLAQLSRASAHLSRVALADFDRLLDRLPALLEPATADGASLLHGDLWNGNVHMTTDGPALIDPSCWYGHREVDLAMAALFGGFPAAFRAAYEAYWPLVRGWQQRRHIYQLYYLLVHVNLFGGSYAARTEATVRAALA